MNLSTGSRLGPYEIVSRIGAGGMGEVWRATDTRLERSVAIKVLPSEFAADAQLRVRFEREAKTISQLNHPHICTLHDVGFESGTQYLVTISPDGHYVTYHVAREGKHMLWLRPLDGDARPLPGTEQAIFPFWSADSRYIAFFAEGKLKKVDLNGAPPLVLCDVQENPRSGSWNSDGVILFSPTSLGPICRIAAAGGAVTPVTKLDTAADETTHRWASFLPDGKHFLYLAATHSAGTKSETNAIYVDSIEKPQRKLILRARSNAIYANGYLLYTRDRTLVAHPFDVSKLELTGDPVPVAQNVQYGSGFFRAAFDAARDGTLLYAASPVETKSTMHYYDRSGKQLEQIGEPDEYSDMNISPDGKRIAVTIVEPSSGVSNIWLYDLQRNVRTRFTFGSTDRFNPIWSSDGSKIAFGAAQGKGAAQNICIKDVNGSADERVVMGGPLIKSPTSFSPDDRTLLVNIVDFTGKTRNDVWSVPLDGSGKPHALLETAAAETNAVYSFDGKWILYSSDESGRAEMYVMPASSKGGKWQVSANGGVAGEWSSDMREIAYVTPDGKLIAVPFSAPGGVINLGTPAEVASGIDGITGGLLMPDHSRFIFARLKSTAVTVNVVTNWPATLKK